MKRFCTITIKTDPDTMAEIEALRHTFFPVKTISQMGHILLRRGTKDIKRVHGEASEIGYTSIK